MKEKYIKSIWCDFQELRGRSSLVDGMSLTTYNIEGIDESELDEIMGDDDHYRSIYILKDKLTKWYEDAIESYKKTIEEISKIEEKDLYQTESYKEYLKSKLQAV